MLDDDAEPSSLDIRQIYLLFLRMALGASQLGRQFDSLEIQPD
jgi:hypothetical protein